MIAIAAFVLSFLGAVPGLSPDVEDLQPSPVVAAVWCTEMQDGAPGCDSGAGVAIHRWGRLALAGGMGTETLGLGLAWTVHRTDKGRAFAVALGGAVRYDLQSGVDLDQAWVTLGCTLSLMPGRR